MINTQFEEEREWKEKKRKEKKSSFGSNHV
jgi:hypothetical protein